MVVDQAKQAQYRRYNREAAVWLDSACATDDAQTAANCLQWATNCVEAMRFVAQTPAELALGAALDKALEAVGAAVPT